MDSRFTDNVKGMFCMVLATSSMVGMYVVLRLTPEGLHPFVVSFWRNFFGLCFLAGWYIPRSGLLVFRTRMIKLHMIRGVLNTIAMLCFFYAIFRTPLADVAALGHTAPLFASVWAILFLGEPLRFSRVLAMVAGFLGALLILRPGPDLLQSGGLLIVFSAAIWSIALVIIKKMSREDSSITIALYMVVFMTPMSLVAALPYWSWPTFTQLGYGMVIAALGTTAQVLLGQSFRFADSTVVMPLDFLKLLWGALAGYWIFSEVPTTYTWVGGAIIIASSIYLTIKER